MYANDRNYKRWTNYKEEFTKITEKMFRPTTKKSDQIKTETCSIQTYTNFVHM